MRGTLICKARKNGERKPSVFLYSGFSVVDTS